MRGKLFRFVSALEWLCALAKYVQLNFITHISNQISLQSEHVGDSRIINNILRAMHCSEHQTEDNTDIMYGIPRGMNVE